MASSCPTSSPLPEPRMGETQFAEILDEEFARYIEVAKGIMSKLKNPKDKEICGRFIKKALALDAACIEVKTNRNEFFKYFLKTLRTTAETQPAYYDNWFRPRADNNKDGGKEEVFWSPDGRTYVAAKTIPNVGTLIYIACAKSPEFGWQNCGFSNYDF